MAWENEIFGLFDELEQRAERLFDDEREIELADRARAEYAQVTLQSRLAASLDAELTVQVRGWGQVRGVLRRTGTDWCLIAGSGHDWVIRTDAVDAVIGASPRSVPEAAWSVVHRLGLASVLRRIADAGEVCTVHLTDGSRHEMELTRVGADFVEGRAGSGSGERSVMVSLRAVAAVRSPEIE